MVCAIIVAAGHSTRMGRDKLFLPIADRPLVAHTWQRFDHAPAIDELILVVRPDLAPAFAELQTRFQFRKPARLVPGGPERQESVWNGLEALPPSCDLVAIQDAARPCTSPAIIEATLQAAQLTGAAVAAQRITDTIKESDGTTLIAHHLDRSRLWAVQTPQAFRVPIIRRALAAARSQGLRLTDDTAACAHLGQPVQLVEDPNPNPKLTTPSDLPFLQFLLTQAPPSPTP